MKTFIHTLGIAIVLGGSLLAISCGRPRGSSVSKPPEGSAILDFRIGRLHVSLPPHWTWLTPAPREAVPGDPECACPHPDSLMLGVAAEIPLPRILTGTDTLVLDTVHSIFWPGDCYEGCYYSYEWLRENGKINEWVRQNEESRAAVKERNPVHKVMPSVIEQKMGGITLFAMNGLYHVFGRSGLYFSGNSTQRPFNLYGRLIQPQTMEELYAVWRSARWE